MRTLVVCQARTGSTRLPGKVLLPVLGKTLLEWQLTRMRAATTPFELVVATTFDDADDPIRDVCRGIDVPCLSGHPTDLLDRHYQAARAFAAEVVVKIPSDCPLIDPAAIDRVLGAFDPDVHDYVSNLHPPSWPDGNDVEVMSFEALETAWRHASRDFEREHCTPFLWERPERFRIGNVRWETGLDYSMTHRFTLDYREDYELVRAVYEALHSPWRPVFPLSDVLALLAQRPDVFALNARFAGVNWYRHHLGELRTVDVAQTRIQEAAP